MIELKSKKFILRPYRKGDEKNIVKYANDKTIAKNTSNMPYPYTEKDAKDWIKKNLVWYGQKNPENFVLAIEINGELVGTIGLHHIQKEHKAELGYWLGKEFRGQGVMTEAVGLMTRYALNDLKLRRVSAYVYAFNEGSKRVLEKCGFILEGIVKKELKKGNKFIDAYLLAKVR